MKAWDEFRANRARLTEARTELEDVASRSVEETDDYLAANKRVADIQDSAAVVAAVTGESRNFDGAPETEADRRFFDLRDSGYKGPIDQDGNADTTSEGAEILRHMAQRRGEEVDW